MKRWNITKLDIKNIWKQHKKWVLAFTAVAMGIGVFTVWQSLGKKNSDVLAKGYVRTTVLTKSTFNNTVSASGSVGSSEVSNVTTSLKYTVKSVNVKVGDAVKKGDILAVLDSAELENSIKKAKEALAENIDKAQSAYDKAAESHRQAVSERDAAKTEMESKKAALDTAKAAYETAYQSLSAFQTAYEKAYSAQQEAGITLNLALTLKNTNSTPENEAAYIAAQQAYNEASAKTASAEQTLNEAKRSCSFDALSASYSSAQSGYDKANESYKQLEKSVSTAAENVTLALSSLSKSKTSDELENLESQLDKCTLKAETDGVVTALNATVGNICTESVASIQNTGKLKVAITLEEYDVQKVQLGMKVSITSDALETVVTGTVIQISPVASSSDNNGSSSSSGFAAEVSIDTEDSGLLIGMNAKAEIIISSKENVFVVPYDAVGKDEEGNSVIYVRQSGSDEEAVFEPVIVTTGEENDYFIEISGDTLQEGMIVRASANAEEAETSNTESGGMRFDQGMSMPEGGMTEGNMPSGGVKMERSTGQ